MSSCQVYEWETIQVLLWVVELAHSVHQVVLVVPVVVHQHVLVLVNQVLEDLPCPLQWRMLWEMLGQQVVQAVPVVPADIHRMIVLEVPVDVVEKEYIHHYCLEDSLADSLAGNVVLEENHHCHLVESAVPEVDHHQTEETEVDLVVVVAEDLPEVDCHPCHRQCLMAATNHRHHSHCEVVMDNLIRHQSLRCHPDQEAYMDHSSLLQRCDASRAGSSVPADSASNSSASLGVALTVLWCSSLLCCCASMPT